MHALPIFARNGFRFNLFAATILLSTLSTVPPRPAFCHAIGIARHSETLEELVVYRALYGQQGLWVRPRKMFEESVVVKGRRVPRFKWVGVDGKVYGKGSKCDGI